MSMMHIIYILSIIDMMDVIDMIHIMANMYIMNAISIMPIMDIILLIIYDTSNILPHLAVRRPCLLPIFALVGTASRHWRQADVRESPYYGRAARSSLRAKAEDMILKAVGAIRQTGHWTVCRHRLVWANVTNCQRAVRGHSTCLLAQVQVVPHTAFNLKVQDVSFVLQIDSSRSPLCPPKLACVPHRRLSAPSVTLRRSCPLTPGVALLTGEVIGGI